MGGGAPSTDIGPGLGAFVAFFALALLLWLLMRNMNGRMRRMAYAERERVARLQEREDARRGESAGAPAPGEPSGSGESPESPDSVGQAGSAPSPGGPPAAGPTTRGDHDDDEHP